MEPITQISLFFFRGIVKLKTATGTSVIAPEFAPVIPDQDLVNTSEKSAQSGGPLYEVNIRIGAGRTFHGIPVLVFNDPNHGGRCRSLVFRYDQLDPIDGDGQQWIHRDRVLILEEGVDAFVQQFAQCQIGVDVIVVCAQRYVH